MASTLHVFDREGYTRRGEQISDCRNVIDVSASLLLPSGLVLLALSPWDDCAGKLTRRARPHEFESSNVLYGKRKSIVTHKLLPILGVTGRMIDAIDADHCRKDLPKALTRASTAAEEIECGRKSRWMWQRHRELLQHTHTIARSAKPRPHQDRHQESRRPRSVVGRSCVPSGSIRIQSTSLSSSTSALLCVLHRCLCKRRLTSRLSMRRRYATECAASIYSHDLEYNLVRSATR